MTRTTKMLNSFVLFLALGFVPTIVSADADSAVDARELADGVSTTDLHAQLHEFKDYKHGVFSDDQMAMEEIRRRQAADAMHVVELAKRATNTTSVPETTVSSTEPAETTTETSTASTTEKTTPASSAAPTTTAAESSKASTTAESTTTESTTTPPTSGKTASKTTVTSTSTPGSSNVSTSTSTAVSSTFSTSVSNKITATSTHTRTITGTNGERSTTTDIVVVGPSITSTEGGDSASGSTGGPASLQTQGSDGASTAKPLGLAAVAIVAAAAVLV